MRNDLPFAGLVYEYFNQIKTDLRTNNLLESQNHFEALVLGVGYYFPLFCACEEEAECCSPVQFTLLHISASNSQVF